MSLDVQHFEPVYLELEPARITDHGQRWLEQRYDENERFNSTLNDIGYLAVTEKWKWSRIYKTLIDEGIPVAVANGISQYMMQKAMDHLVGKLSFTMPAVVAAGLDTAAPSSTSTGASQAETAYTGYGTTRLTFSTATFNSATAATPSVSLNAATLTFNGCTSGSASTLLGFTLNDNATVGSGNVLWFGGLTSTTISPTQTPPTIAAGALSLSLATSP